MILRENPALLRAVIIALIIVVIAVVIIAMSLRAHTPQTPAISCVFHNPILPFGQDPSVVFHNGYYYLVQSTAGKLTIAKSNTLTGLGRATPVPIYTPPPRQPYSYDLWAPELVYLQGKWYIYVAATSWPGDNATHRMFVLQADTDDPQGSWTMKGKVYDPASDKWAIDGTVFEFKGQLYMVWSGWPGDTGDFPQNLYIAPMSDPLTISGERRLLSEPDQSWERSVAAIQEGPEAFIHNGQLSIVYSADASWSAAYKLGLLKWMGGDPLEASSWTKIGPVFSGYSDETGAVYGPGHNSTPVPSPDGSEDWLFYHAKMMARDGWDDRAIFAQKFTWNEDGTPNFGQPIAASVAQELPAGEPCGLIVSDEDIVSSAATSQGLGTFELQESFIDTGVSWIDTRGSFSVALWAKLADTSIPSTMISQDGGISSFFALEYTGTAFAWTLFDPFGENPVSAVSSVNPTADQWYHLVGVRDARNNEIRLYVDGELQAQATFNEQWDARGNTILGAARRTTQRVGLFTGTLKGVQLYNGALDGSEIRKLAAEY